MTPTWTPTYVIGSTLLYAWIIFCIVLVFHKVLQAGKRQQADNRGWVYFVTARGDTESPVLIGRSVEDPKKGLLPDLSGSSPVVLTLVHSFPCSDAVLVEKALNEELAEYRVHDSWFDRDAALSLLTEITNGEK